jgi:pimeloyl-ACP methyl ester carboxylesterase
MLERPDGMIHYEVFGAGFPVLLFAPGGLRSSIAFWGPPEEGPPRPWVDWTRALPAAGFTAIAMDQRNAGASRAAVRADHGWHTYAADHLALMDHLGFERFHVLGGCIGGSFCMMATKTAPSRIVAQVLQNPIGRNSEHRSFFQDMHADWSRQMLENRPDLTAEDLAGFGHNMWDHEFIFCADRDFVRGCTTPSFLLPGSDTPHPAETSAELAQLLPNVTVLTDWRGPAHLAQQERQVAGFLKAHTPA